MNITDGGLEESLDKDFIAFSQEPILSESNGTHSLLWNATGPKPKIFLPWRTNILKGRKRRAFAADGPLVATPALHGDDDNDDDDVWKMPSCVHHSKTETIEENRTTFKHLESSVTRYESQPLPAQPFSPCRTTPLTPPGTTASPLSCELSRFGRLVIQSPFSAFSPGNRSHHSPSFHDHSPASGIPSPFRKQQPRRRVPISLVVSGESPASLRNPARNQNFARDSPARQSVFTFPKMKLTPRATNKSLSLDPLPTSRQSMMFPKAAGDFDFAFDRSSDGSLTDSDDDDDDKFFLCGPDKGLSSEHAKKLKPSTPPLPFGDDDRKRSPNLKESVSTIVPPYFLKERRSETPSSTDSAPTSRYSSSSSLFGMSIVHEERPQQLIDDMVMSSFKPNLCMSRTGDPLTDGAITKFPFLVGAARDLITPPVMCADASEPPPFRQRK